MIHSVNDRIEVYGDVVVIGCMHIPFQSMSLLQKIKETCVGTGIKTAIYAGDFLNNGEYGKYKTKGDRWKEVKHISRGIFSWMDGFIDTHVFIKGNHDGWYFRKMDEIQDMEDLMDLIVPTLKDVHYTNKDFCVVRTPDGMKDFRISHSHKYYNTPGELPRRIGVKYGMNVIQCHSHIGSRLSIIRDNDESVYMDGFCACDLEKMDYERDNTTLFHPWACGATTLIGGKPSVIINDDTEKSRHEINVKTAHGKTNGKYLEVWERRSV